MKELLKKLNNFKSFSLILSLTGLVEVIVMVVSLILYQTSSPVTINSDGTIEEKINHAFSGNQIAGMIFFIEVIIAIILGIVVVYKTLPFVFPKQKLNPTRVFGYVQVAGGVFSLAFAIQVIYLVSTEQTRYLAGWVILIILSLLVALFSFALVYPNVKCHFYCPDPNKK